MPSIESIMPHMKISAKLALILILPCLLAHRAKAQQYADTANQCVRSFWDPNSYNWLSYENTCNQPIHITMVSNAGTSVGMIDLGPGRHDGPGLSAREVQAIRGIEVYACPANYTAFDINDQMIINRPVAHFRCKRS